MQIRLLCISALLSIFSTAVMSYISMATPIGPWIAPTLVLLAAIIFKIILQEIKAESVALVVMAGSIGGILATALGFSFPTLYFVDPDLFNNWMGRPLFFAGVVGGVSFIAGWLGLWLSYIAERQLIMVQQLPFPIGQLVYKMITAITQQLRKAYELIAGFVATTLFCVFQDGVGALTAIIPQTITLVPTACVGFIRIPLIRFDLVPFVWAVGFLTGHVVAIPLLVGMISRIIILDPIHLLPIFCHLSSTEFVLAFCSGLVLIGTITSFVALPQQIYQGVKKYASGAGKLQLRVSDIPRELLLELGVLIAVFILFFSYFRFSILAQIFIFVATALCAYQMAAIAGKIGMALLGRFATFVMIPGMLLFKFDVMQAVLVATFVEVCGGVMTDALFGRIVARETQISQRAGKLSQYFGLVIACCVVGGVFWLLIDYFHLGSEQLFAQKAQARQLLLQAQQFDVSVLCIGVLFGLLLNFVKINPALVFGGLLMPVNLVLGLVVGGLCASCVKHKEEYYPFFSGVFAAQSIWMLVKTFFSF